MSKKSNIIHVSKVDETPAAAAASLLPMLEIFLNKAGITIKEHDISLATRILSLFGLAKDGLAELGKIVKQKDAAIIKMPNISATLPQLKEAIKELQEKGFNIPKYPESPKDSKEKEIKEKYDSVLGSVANPVLRQGNSIRFVPESVKNEARRNPHKMGKWTAQSKTRISHMDSDDFAGTEISSTINDAVNAKIEFIDKDGNITILKDNIELKKHSIIDAAIMKRASLRKFMEEQISQAKKEDLLLSFHYKATMMVKTDGVFFGDSVKAYFKELFDKYQDIFDKLNINPSSGMNALREKIKNLSPDKYEEINDLIEKIMKEKAEIAFINPKEGKRNLDDPSLIIDISMANLIRWSTMPSSTGERETLAIIPDRTFATTYQVAIDDMKENGSLNPAIIGSVENIGLMAEKAEEYGSKPTTVTSPSDGEIRTIDENGNIISTHKVNKEDIYRICRTTKAAIDNWIETTIKRSKDSDKLTIFWLDEKRPHDREILKIINSYNDLPPNIKILPPKKAMKLTLQEIRAGNNVIAATGNVWRDYLTDLFPILEVASNAKMTSLVPMLNGGLMAETGAGGTAVDLYKTFLATNRLKWDSIGDFTATSEILKELGKRGNNKASILATTLDKALDMLIKNGEVPSQSGIDTREHHLRLAQHWINFLSQQDDDIELKETFLTLSKNINQKIDKISDEINKLEGQKVKLDGYYHLSRDEMEKAIFASLDKDIIE